MHCGGVRVVANTDYKSLSGEAVWDFGNAIKHTS